MKGVILPVLLIFCLSVSLKAQQLPAANDSLLLDYYQNQRFAEAVDYLKKTYPEPVTNIKVLSKLAYTSQMAGKLPDAEVYYQRIYNIDSTNTAVLFSLGGINLRRGNNLKAEVYYKMIVRKDTSNFLVYKQLGKICLEKGDLTGMMLNLQKANNINPSEPDVAADLSDLYVTLKHFAPAEKVLNTAIEADLENTILIESLLKLTYSQKKWPETIEAALKLTKLGNNTAGVLNKLATAYYYTKNYACSVETIADIPKISLNETSYYTAGIAYKELKDQRSAIENLNNAITAGISENINTYYSEIGDSYETLKKFKKAIIAYQKGLEFDEKPITYYLMATIYDADLKNKKLALKYYKKYMQSKPPVKEGKYVSYSRERVKALGI